MESSIPLRSGPLRGAGSQEPEIGSSEVLEDEPEHTGRKHTVDPLLRSGANVFALTGPQSARSSRSVSPFRGRFRGHCSSANIFFGDFTSSARLGGLDRTEKLDR
jgi:hypothetical protein